MRGAPQKKIDTTELDKEIKEIKAKLRKCYNRKEAIIDETLLGLDNLNQLETVCLLSKLH